MTLFCSLANASVPSTVIWPAIQAKNLLTGSAFEITEKQLTQKLATVFVFVSSECPCSISHQTHLNELQSKFKNVAFYGVLSAENLTDAKAHFQKTPLEFPILLDPDAKLADRFQALKTPHAFVVNAHGEIVYRGGVDEKHDGNIAKNRYLESALSAMTAGKNPVPAETKPLGCRIEH